MRSEVDSRGCGKQAKEEERLLFRMTLARVCSETHSHPKRLPRGANSPVPGSVEWGGTSSHNINIPTLVKQRLRKNV